MNWAEMVDKVDSELGVVNAKLAEHDPLLQKKALLEATRENLLALAAASNGHAGHVPRTPMVIEQAVRPNEDPQWRGVRAALLGLDRPGGAPEIVRLMRDSGWRLTENAREVIRGHMIRKADVFERVGEGLYALVEWPEEKKRLDEVPEEA